MSKQIKPGMLCIVRGATQTLSLNGMIVKVEKRSVHNTEYQSSCGVKVTVWPEDNWDCSGGEYLPWTHQSGRLFTEQDVEDIMQTKELHIAEQHREREVTYA